MLSNTLFSIDMRFVIHHYQWLEIFQVLEATREILKQLFNTIHSCIVISQAVYFTIIETKANNSKCEYLHIFYSAHTSVSTYW